MHVEIHGFTDVGLRRSQNEDHHAWWSDPSVAADPSAVLVVADGMGGASAGEVASQLAVDFVLAGARALGLGASEEALREVVESANTRVHDDSLAHPERRGMGTTCTAVVLRPGRGLFAHVGDSRGYLIHHGAIRQFTRDHSLVAQLVEFQHLTPEEAKTDPRRNVVTRSLGVGAHLDVDTGTVELADGDTLLVCSDGLHGLLEDHELFEIASEPDLATAGADMVELAKQRGGHDNITVVIARMHAAGNR